MSRARDRQEHAGHTYEDQWSEEIEPEDRIDESLEGEPMTTTATVELTISDEICRHFLTACVESASAYWLQADRVVYTGHDTDDYGVSEIIGCADAEDRKEKWGNANFDTIRLGFQRLLAPGANVAANIKQEALEALTDPDSSSWDDWTADAVLQFGLLGELVYG